MVTRHISLARVPAAALLALLLFAAGGSAPVGAADFTVDSTADAVDANPGDGICDDGAGNCTLRAAIQETNALPSADTITLPAGAYTLSIPGADEDAAASGDLDITDDLTLTGADRVTTVIDGGAIDRVFHVIAGTVEISGVTIRNGMVPPENDGGGGIRNQGTLTLANVTVSGNTAGMDVGGGLLFGVGGGIFNAGGSTLTVTNSTITGNTITGQWAGGGGINNEGTLSLTNSAIAGNTSTAGTGGGINNIGPLILANSAIVGNMASSGLGGGIWNNGPATLTNVTISGNTGGSGGAIYNDGDGTLTLTHSTVSNNTTLASASSISNLFGSVMLTNTIMANNLRLNCSGTQTSGGHNLDSDGSCSLSHPTDLTGVDPLLGPLADNGGLTQTHALLSGSPAIDAGDCPPPDTDQRGVSRPIDGDSDGIAVCDIGAYEAPAGTSIRAPTPMPTPTSAVLGIVQLPDSGGEPASSGSGALPWPAAIAGGIVVMSAGSALVAVRRRR